MSRQSRISSSAVSVAVPLIIAVSVFPLFGQDWILFDLPVATSPTAGSMPNPSSLFVQPPQINEAPDHSPDDPKLARFLEMRQAYSTASKQFVEESLKQDKLYQQQNWEIENHIFESRKQEIVSLKPKKEPNGAKLKLDILTFPELDGSTSCANLGVIVTSRVLQIPYAWQMNDQNSDADNLELRFEIVPDAKKTAFRERNIFRDYFGHYKGTHQSYMSLIGPPNENADTSNRGYGSSGISPTASSTYSAPSTFPGPFMPPTLDPDESYPAAEIILVARKPSQDELTAAKQAGVELDVRPIARDAFIFLVSRKNPVESLTLEQIQSIFATQQQRNWNEFGGNNSQITPFERERNSGSREVMDELIVTAEVIKKYNPQPTQQGTNPGASSSPSVNPPAAPYSGRPSRPRYSPPSSLYQPIDPPAAPYPGQPSGSSHYSSGSYSSPSSSAIADPTPISQPYGGSPSQPNPSLPPLPQVQATQPYGVQPSDTDTSFRDYRPGARAFVGMGGPFMMISQNHNTIAYSFYHYEHFMNCVLDTRVLAVNGVMPSSETIRSGKYPLCCDVYVVTRKDIAADSPAAKLRDWLLSDDGQNCIAESGYIPIRGGH